MCRSEEMIADGLARPVLTRFTSMSCQSGARQAKRYSLMVGWKFDSGVRLPRGPDATEASGPAELLPFLKSLVETNPELMVKILAWDYSVIYAWEWEWNLPEKFSTP